MTIPRPCIVCGEPTPESRCAEHRLKHNHTKASRTARGYDAAWQRLSTRARKLQPFCSDIHLGGCKGELQADHTPEAWRRKARGLPIMLCHITVRCAHHNRMAGAARGANVTRTD